MKTLSFVIPVYNEEKRLNKTFIALKQGFSFSGIRLEKVIFVDDGSTDKTKSLIVRHKSSVERSLKTKVQIISYKENKGKGYAIHTGLAASTSDYTLFFDADMSTPLSEFSKFIPFIEKNIDVIIGTRKNGHSTIVKHQPFVRELMGRCFTHLTQIVLNTWVTDFTCGFKLFSKNAKNEILNYASINRWGYDAELIFLARKLGFSIQEKAVLWANDEQTKVNMLVAIPQTLIELFFIRYNFTKQRMNEFISSLSLPARKALKMYRI